jgi:membrane peptidoglycan carboxypeptidase
MAVHQPAEPRAYPDDTAILPAPVPVRRRRRGWRLIRRALAVLIALLVLGAIVFGGLLGITPSAGNAPALARGQARAHHVAYPGPPVPPRFAAALTATEDHRFYSEPGGIDVFAIGRVALSYLTGHGDQGAATLYQQLAKLLYTPGQSGPWAIARQLALAVKLDLTYSKQQILQMYSAVVYFGHGFYGLGAASCGYFGKRPAALSWPQAALLAGLVRDPSLDDPLAHPAAGRAREEHVIGRLVATGKLSPASARAALAIPLSRLLVHAGHCGH